MESFDSKEEEYFSWWVAEMVEAGVIESATYQPKPFVLTEPVTRTFVKRKVLKTKTNELVCNIPLLSKHSYTADWAIVFTDEFVSSNLGVLADVDDLMWVLKKPSIITSGGVWYVDIKGSMDRFGGSRHFSSTQKMLFSVHNIYVQKIIISNKTDSYFNTTFAPAKYLKTDKSGKPRAIKFKTSTVKSFLKKALL